jgi:penicillin-binding protein 1B
MKSIRWILILFLVGLLGFGGLFYRHFSGFNTIVKEKFEGRLWELPARVYARPLVLYPGLELSVGMLEKELVLMGYQRESASKDLDVPGKYTRSGNRFHLFCRPFDFGDEKKPSHGLVLEIEQNRVVVLKTPGKTLVPDMVKLDPVLVGSFYPVSKEDRILVDFETMPPLLPNTIIAVEDRTFYTHYGVNYQAIFRAMLVNIKHLEMTQGASTITQQLARNFFLSREKTWTRKVNELFMAAALELNYDKQQILEAYVNEVYLGQDGNRAIHGFGLACVFYFGKSIRDVRPHEVALLVGMLKGPSYYNPHKYPDRALGRRNRVLKMMGEQKLISRAQMDKAVIMPLGVIKTLVQGNFVFPDYLDLVKRRLLIEYRETDLRSMGLKIFTALDPQVQMAARQTLESQLKRLSAKKGVSGEMLEASVVVTATGSNEVLALVGGKNPHEQGFNRGLDARRPIGSLVKPAVFLTALSHPETYTLVTRVDDGPIRIKLSDGQWAPKNFDRKYHGQVPLYRALVNSYNASTVRLGMDIGLSAIFETLQKMGFKRKVPLYPSSLLGSLEMSPFEVAQIYQTLAANGFYSPAKVIRSIYTPGGDLLHRYPLTIEQRLDSGAVFLVNKMLQAVVLEGTGKSLGKILPENLGVAGKTGSTNDLKDSWFAGFSGNHLAVVWVGRDDNTPCNLTGSAGAMQIFGHLMGRISNQPLGLVAPENVEWAVVDGNTGLRTEETCPGAMAIPFIKGSVPRGNSACNSGGTSPSSNKKKKKPRYLMDWIKEWIK